MPAPASAAPHRLAVTGMTCTGCVNAVTRALSRVLGATDIHVMLDTAQAEIGGHADPQALLAAVRKAGFGAELLAP